MIERFISALTRAGIALDHKQIAETLWLARLIAEDEPVESIAAPKAKGLRPEKPPGKPETGQTGAETVAREEKVDLYAGPPPAVSILSTGGLPASKVRAPGVAALGDPLGIGRALRPLSRRFASRRLVKLNEEQTAQQTAERGYISLAFDPVPERWFDVVLLIEETLSMVVWRQAIRELATLLESHGAFRDVRQYKFRLAGERLVLSEPDDNVCSPAMLKTSDGRRIIFLLSDCVTPLWRDGALARLIRDWAETMPVVVWQMLGERLWRNSALGAPDAVVKSLLPGLPNTMLSVEMPWWRRDRGESNAGGLPLPVITFEPEWIAEWARMTMGAGDCRAVVLPDKAESVAPDGAPAPEVGPAERVARFRALVSPEAYELAILLSVTHLMLPVMRLIQRAMIGAANDEQLAELLLGGILTPLPSATREEPVFDYRPGVRQILWQKIKLSEVDRVFRSVSLFISHRLHRPFDLRALVKDPAGKEQIEDWMRPFADIALSAVEHFGFAQSKVARSGLSASDRQERTVTKALPPLTGFEFETVTLNERGKETDRRTLSARHYVEDLGDNITLEMVEILGGKFTMGSSKGEEGSYDDERPQHEVRVPPFFIGKHPVTQAQWRAVARLPKVKIDLKPDPSHFKGDHLPVESVSWDEAKEFIARLNAKLGLGEENGYRLPSEAEWEYAARAGSQTAFAFGETINPEIVNYQGDYPYGQAPKGKNRGKTVEVGSLGVANAWGLFDMHGNVWEWCEDQWHDSYEGAPADGSAWVDISEGALYRVYRGGGWGGSAAICRSAFRGHDSPGNRVHDLGLRLSRTYR